jgi:hypothetical protein
MAGLSIPSSDKDRLAYVKANNKAITIIVPRLNARVYNKVVNKETIDYAVLLWDRITSQYASHSVVNCGRVYMRWSNLLYGGDLQTYINKTCAPIPNIETVNITITKELPSYLILGKFLNKDLDQVVGKISLSLPTVPRIPI